MITDLQAQLCRVSTETVFRVSRVEAGGIAGSFTLVPKKTSPLPHPFNQLFINAKNISPGDTVTNSHRII